MALSANLGLPRIGPRRELKTALESYWAGRIDQDALQGAARTIRLNQWTLQKEMGIDHIPSNDFSFYDHVLDTACMLGCVPARFNFEGPAVDLDTYFAMARGNDQAPAMEMTAPSTSLEVQLRIMGVISAPTIPHSKFTAASKTNRPIKPGRAEM